MTEAERILHDAIMRLLKSWTLISPLRRCFEAGLPAAKINIERESNDYFARVFRIPEVAAHVGAPRSGIPAQEIARQAREWAAQTTERASIMVRATELIFHHSMVDAAASDCCRAITLLDPSGSDRYLREQQVKLGQLLEGTTEQVFAEARSRFAKQLENKSLPNRADWIHAMCRPSRGTVILQDYAYDRERLKRLDDARHDAVHGMGPSASDRVTDEDVQFLSPTGVYLCQLVMHAHGIELNSDYTSKWWK